MGAGMRSLGAAWDRHGRESLGRLVTPASVQQTPERWARGYTMSRTLVPSFAPAWCGCGKHRHRTAFSPWIVWIGSAWHCWASRRRSTVRVAAGCAGIATQEISDQLVLSGKAHCHPGLVAKFRNWDRLSGVDFASLDAKVLDTKPQHTEIN